MLKNHLTLWPTSQGMKHITLCVQEGWAGPRDSETSPRVPLGWGSGKYSLFAKPLLQPRAPQLWGFRGRELQFLGAGAEKWKMGFVLPFLCSQEKNHQIRASEDGEGSWDPSLPTEPAHKTGQGEARQETQGRINDYDPAICFREGFCSAGREPGS